jgi:hypothetical protein
MWLFERGWEIMEFTGLREVREGLIFVEREKWTGGKERAFHVF